MQTILIAGAGNIGTVIAHLLATSGDYQVFLADTTLEKASASLSNTSDGQITPVALDVTQTEQAIQSLQPLALDAIVSCLPHQLNLAIATLAQQLNVHYFDLTEDLKTSLQIKALSKASQKAFVCQCGLAPGMIDIIANDLIQQFDVAETVKLRCGALPLISSNPLQYSLTWSTDGLINEYGNQCEILDNYEKVCTPGLSNLEEIQIDGVRYEAFSTSGGLGTLAQTYEGKIKTMNYKSMRYPGHCEKMRFLMYSLKLNQDRDTLKHILETALPETDQDVVIVYVSVHGQLDGKFKKQDYIRKFYPREINGRYCAAIQITTATSAAIIIDHVLHAKTPYHGHVTQDVFSLDAFFNHRFAAYFDQQETPCHT